jgi:uncharacterized protein (UPF0333 family)
MFLKQTKAQTSLEFLIIVLALILIAMSATLFLLSTFDINVGLYKVKNKTIQFIANDSRPLVISAVTYAYNTTDLNFTVILKKADASIICPTLTDYNYSSLEEEIDKRTKYNNINVKITCN